MGKIEGQGRNQRTQEQVSRSSLNCCCFTTGIRRIAKAFSFRCLLFLILGAGVSLSAILWLPPFRSMHSGFDATDADRLGALVQASFTLQKPVSMLVAHTERLEQEILDEIEIPNTKVSIISMHPLSTSNLTHVVFGVLPDPSNAPIALLPLSILRSSLIELVLQQLNLTLTQSIFGQPSSFEVLKFPGGLTLIPGQPPPIWQRPQILFNFTLNNSISQIHENADRLKVQLKRGLQLRSYESIYVEVTNLDGSTVSPPVVIQASVVSGFRALSMQRLKQLAEVIASSRMKNLGLDHSVFGKVKQIQLSSYLQDSLVPSPSPSPSSSPSPSPSSSPSPSPSPFPSKVSPVSQSPTTPSYAPDPSTDYNHLSPCFYSEPSSPTSKKGPHLPIPPDLEPPAPSVHRSPRHSPFVGPAISPNQPPTAHSGPPSPDFSRHDIFPPHSQPMSPPSLLDPNISPSPAMFLGPNAHQDQKNGIVLPSSLPDSSQVSPSLSCLLHGGVWLIGMLGFVMPYLLCGPY